MDLDQSSGSSGSNGNSTNGSLVCGNLETGRFNNEGTGSLRSDGLGSG
jgi:hypothetical protein